MPRILYYPQSSLKRQTERKILALEPELEKIQSKHSIHHEAVKVKRIRDIVVNPSKSASKFAEPLQNMSDKSVKFLKKRWSLQQLSIKNENGKKERSFSCSVLPVRFAN